MDISQEKIHGFNKLKEEAIYALCRLEEGIESWKEEIHKLPDDAEKPVKVERINANIKKYSDSLPQVERRLETLNRLIKKYQKLGK